MHTCWRIVCGVILPVLFTAGCSRSSESGAKVRRSSSPTEAEVMALATNYCDRIARIDTNPDLPWCDELYSALDRSSNPVRLKVWSELVDRLPQIDVSGCSYKKQQRAVEVIRLLLDDAVHRLPAAMGVDRSTRKEAEYDLMLKVFAWKREQINRTKPKSWIQYPNAWAGDEIEEERMSWRTIHYGGIRNYEWKLCTMEQWLPNIKPQLSEEAYARVRQKIEAYLGRPIRTEAQAVSDHKSRRWVEFSDEKDDPHYGP